MPAATKAYRLILRLYPPSFRRRFGNEMFRTFTDHRADAKAEGGDLGAKFWLALLADESRNIVHQHATALAAKARLPRPTVSGVALAAIAFPPLFVSLLLAAVNLAVAVPHPPIAGLAVLLGMGLLVAVPALLAALGSYLLGTAMASGLARLRRRKA